MLDRQWVILFEPDKSLWQWAVDNTPTHPKKIKYGVECAGAPEFYEIPESERENYAEWGFSILNLCGNDGMRLPNKDFKYQLAA
jgi:hypothetical protein